MTLSLLDILNDDVYDEKDEVPSLFEQSPYYKNDDVYKILKLSKIFYHSSA